MGSMLSKCAKCGNMIAKGSRCPECRHSENEEDQDEERQLELARQYQEDMQRHKRNYTVFMILMLCTGALGLYAAFLWLGIIYRGSIVNFILLAITNIVLLILAGMLKMSRKFLPTDVNCPACGVRLDEVGLEDDGCPGCKIPLR